MSKVYLPKGHEVHITQDRTCGQTDDLTYYLITTRIPLQFICCGGMGEVSRSDNITWEIGLH